MRHSRGITLIEMMIVVMIISLMIGITFPAVSSGLESLRLRSATNDVISVFNQALSRAQRSQQVVEVSISRSENALWLRAPQARYERKYEMPEGVTIARVIAAGSPGVEEDVRDFFLYPGGSVPRFGVEMVNARGTRRIVSVDPITGVARVQDPSEDEEQQ